MSSPLGGFYLAAQHRVKAAEQAEKQKIRINMHLSLSFGQELLYQGQVTVVVGESLTICATEVELTVMATMDDVSGDQQQDWLCHVEVTVTNSNESRGFEVISQQLNVVKGERLATRFADDDRVLLQIDTSDSA